MSAKTSKSSLIKNEGNASVGGPFPHITCMEDIINNFFNQIVQYVIDDLVVVDEEEGEETEIISQNNEDVVKNYKELKPEDLSNAEITGVAGTNVTLRRKSSTQKKNGKTLSRSSNLSVIREESGESLTSKTSTTSSSSDDPPMDGERRVKIVFTNGNTYLGMISKRIMNGKGKYSWTDGAVYEGNFKDGFPYGKGKLILPDLSYYEGEFHQGYFEGLGFLNVVSTPTYYSGHWKKGVQHGYGWLLYKPSDWYEGEWVDGLKDGFGVRYYENGGKYRGYWRKGKFEGKGMMIWGNNDFYQGEWKNGLMHGQGEYIWKAFYNNSFAFPFQNTYKGAWKNGKRCGEGTMLFGDESGLKLSGQWEQDFKHGNGYLVCGNGKVVESGMLFQYDKPLKTDISVWSIAHLSAPPDFPLFSAPENVEVGCYVEDLISNNNLKISKVQEEKNIKRIITRYLPQLRELYQEYATIASKTTLRFKPIMVRLFLWQFYRDREIWKCGISLAKTDIILFNNEKCCLDSAHNPFEPIYFWQFLMSLIGVALTTSDLTNIHINHLQGVSATILKKFFDEIVFSKESNHEDTLLTKYLDLAPIEAVYLLYKKLGEPHSARTFLKESCVREGEHYEFCYLNFNSKTETKCGTNLVPLDHNIFFEKSSIQHLSLSNDLKHNWRSLYDFRHLGPRNVLRCLSKTCPLIMSDNLVVNIDYPLTFIEFYDTILTCIFMILELEMKREKKRLRENITAPSVSTINKSKSSSDNSLKKANKEKKVGGKNAKKKKKA